MRPGRHHVIGSRLSSSRLTMCASPREGQPAVVVPLRCGRRPAQRALQAQRFWRRLRPRQQGQQPVCELLLAQRLAARRDLRGQALRATVWRAVMPAARTVESACLPRKGDLWGWP